ncbi:hypothetical protein [Metaclostridioides mangenotii]|uniref:Uncharacterized protein n=1 Tax=Metaclostridioides mangenotii TaxID=1540 RepID=A0ABS4ECY1_9FIRM|nr:hypothetical protein [Clostridioides mangenotii]MBP1855798.1 hypothetical protein [Clostridioides mangenotii]
MKCKIISEFAQLGSLLGYFIGIDWIDCKISKVFSKKANMLGTESKEINLNRN